MTKTGNHIYFLVCALAALLAAVPPEVMVLIPQKAKPYVIGVAALLMWIKSHYNLIADPPQENQPKSGGMK